jgi:hypothetical protein
MLISLFLMVSAVALSSWTLGPTPVSEIATRGFLLIVQALLLMSGICVFAHRRRAGLYSYLFAGLVVLVNALLLLLADLVLGWAGFPSLPPLLDVAHPPHFREVRRSFNEYEYQFVSNSQGLRYKEIGLQKESGDEKRIFVLGDSYVEGFGVDYEDMFTSLLESYFGCQSQAIRFINGGLSGTALPQQMQLLFHVGFKYNIDGVVLCVYPNDVTGTPDSIEFAPQIRRISRPDGLAAVGHFFYPRIYSLVMKLIHNPPQLRRVVRTRDIVEAATREALKRGIPQEEIDAWKKRIPNDLLESANRFEFNGSSLTCGLFAPDMWTKCLDMNSESARQSWLNLKKCIQFVHDECNRRRIGFAIVFVPTAYQYVADFYEVPTPMVQSGVFTDKKWLTETSALQRELGLWADSAGVPYLDLTAEFRQAYCEYGQSIVYPLDSHWTPIGHKIAAEAIKRWLEAEDFLGLRGQE